MNKLPCINNRIKCMEAIACGRHGTVYRGVCVHTHREVAVKKLPVRRGDMSQRENVDMIMREAVAWQSVQSAGVHPGVLELEEILDCPEDDAVCFVSRLCKRGEFQGDHLHTIREKSDAIRQILDALHHVHSVGVVHSDVKPQNILVFEGESAFNQYKLADFGSADFISDKYEVYGRARGTPLYAAPELWYATENVAYGCNVDVWALGVLAFQLLSDTDHHPYIHTNSRMAYASMMLQMCQEDHGVVRGMRKEMFEKLTDPCVTPAAKDFLCMCLEPDRRARPSSEDLLGHEFLKM